MRVLDLFSAAAGGWSLGLHRAGFETVAACEWIDWRRALYAENNPGVKIYDDVRTLTGERLLADLGALPDIVVGSPPCQDISSANTKGKGVDGERSGLFFEAVRIIGEVRPRWFALENSANLRTRGSDAVLAALEGVGYTAWAFVVGAGDGKIAAGVGANHDRARSWLIGCDPEQLAHAYRQLPDEWAGQSWPQGQGRDLSSDGAADRDLGRTDGTGAVSWRHGGLGLPADAPQVGCASRAGDRQGEHTRVDWRLAGHDHGDGLAGDAGSPADADQAGQADGSLVTGIRQAEIANDGRGAGWRPDGQGVGQMGLRPTDRVSAFQHRADWSLDDLARHIRLDDGLPAWLAEQRIAVGGPRGTSAASLVVEAFGDAVIPQIPEAIGRAILRVEAAMAAVARQDERSAA